jgi:potassium/chloride transporter 9
MFAPSSSPPRFQNRLESIYTRRSSSGARSASGYPNQASVPLSFDDLPSRAQHLILNELMARQSSQTAVIFTTLPSPSEGTAESEETSESYLSDLEVLWQGLPPCLLVHSNSMTVTMNL